MNLKTTLENEHSKTVTLKIVNYVGNDKIAFKQLLKLFFGNDYVLAQRSSWVVSNVVILHPHLITPYFNKLIKKLNQVNNHPAISRNILKLLQEIDIPQKHHSLLLDTCFKIITNPSKPIASIAFAITVATKICKPYKELTNELLLILAHLQTYAQTPAIKSRINRALKELQKIK